MTTPARTADGIIATLTSQANPDNVAGMGRYGINTTRALGVPMPVLRELARRHGRDHRLAADLWKSGIHEARILACLVEEPQKVTPAQMERWVKQFDSWDLCDQCCANLFDRTPYAYEKAAEWSTRTEEFVRRAAFALMAALAVHDKKADDARFTAFLPLIRKAAIDERNMVRKAVNWALRQIGKRNLALNEAAIATAREIADTGSKSARWIASDALRELTGDRVRERLEKKAR